MVRLQTDLFRPAPQRVLDERRRGATFVEHRVRSVVNSPESTRMGFWSLNPYVGCELGCTYCYARDAHQHVVTRAQDQGLVAAHELDAYDSERWEVFEHRIFVKRREAVLRALDRDLLQVFRRHRLDRQFPIVIGTATDPYQPAERTFEITRTVLERLTRERGLRIGLITKSPTVVRDLDVLEELQTRHRVSVYISLISTDADVIRRFEARSPMPHARLRALERLSAAGIHAGLIVAPILPGITDTVEQIQALARALVESGGRFASPSPLRMYPALHRNFLPVIRQHYPELYPKYRRAYRGSGAAPRSYTDALIRRFRRIATSCGVPVRDPVLEPSGGETSAAADPQLALMFAGSEG